MLQSLPKLAFKQSETSVKVDNCEYYDVPKKVTMSAEVENSKDEDTKEQPKQSLKDKFKKHWQIGIKLLELLLCVGCMGFMYEPANSVHLGKEHLHHTGIMYTAYTGFMLINSVLLVGRALGDRVPFPTIILFATNGACLFFIAGVVLTVDRVQLSRGIFHPRQYQLTMMTISVSLAFINALIFSVDVVLTYLKRQDL